MLYQVVSLTLRGESQTAATLTCYALDNYEEMGVDRVRPAVVVCPGGGYEFLSEREAEPVAIRLLAGGVQAFVLRYHVSPDRYPAALFDAAEAVKHIRENAKKYHVDPDKICVMGFSAGGHLAGHIANAWQEPFVAEALGCDQQALRVNGSILCYPVITAFEHAHRGSFDALLGERSDELSAKVSLENLVGANTPPTFLWHTWPDGCVPVENSILYIEALKKQGISCEAHLYPVGGHGLSLADEETKSVYGNEIEPCCQGWMGNCIRFIKSL